MERHHVAQAVGWAAAAGFLGNAAWHLTGYGSVTQLAAQGPVALRPLTSALWLAFAAGLVILGLIVVAVGRRPSPGGRLILVLAALFPITTAVLQVRFLGFIPPTASLLGVGILTLATASTLPAAVPAAGPVPR